jgi:manganese/iron transport system permease protein
MITHLAELITAPLEYPFMVRALLAVVLVAALCAVLGVYVVLRGMAFLGDALAHAILPGVALGYVVHGGARGPLFWWGLGAAVLASLGIGAVSRGAQIKEDTAIGIIFAGMFALGIALVSTMRSYAVDLSHMLFGNVLSVTHMRPVAHRRLQPAGAARGPRASTRSCWCSRSTPSSPPPCACPCACCTT